MRQLTDYVQLLWTAYVVDMTPRRQEQAVYAPIRKQWTALEDSINAILVDLSQRETEARSRELAELIVREAGDVPLRGRPVQSANFTVLRSPDLPSLLFEAGYISNEADAARLATGEGQRAIADLLARTIRIYFARQAAL